MSRRCFPVLALIFVNVSFAWQVGAQGPPKAPSQIAKKGVPNSGKQPLGDGEKIFAQNCSRCHGVPQGFPPRISGTIVTHMRVRASLSQNEALALLRFLNP